MKGERKVELKNDNRKKTGNDKDELKQGRKKKEKRNEERQVERKINEED
jgi:hypothetical protein